MGLGLGLGGDFFLQVGDGLAAQRPPDSTECLTLAQLTPHTECPTHRFIKIQQTRLDKMEPRITAINVRDGTQYYR